MLKAIKPSRFIVVIVIASFCAACDSKVDVSNNSVEKSTQESPLASGAADSTPPPETISVEQLEQQLSPFRARILALENELEVAQQATTDTTNKKEDKLFEQSLMEQKLSNLLDENQELTDQLTAQEETIQQLQDELSAMNIQHQEELAKQTITQ
ncbi:hypothetical protein [Leucothrix arctica]|uniref:YbgF trimerisation domain-containing protein n=1 Tax=Leucothrix arctica TaxID=1481894 RepID=A0A317CFW0_9GAMM|nr:hypothetical protein [Leucothrix arctica]PWQ97277.1 hypothetical protein DKT75_06990 [Leucothrix arctica]